MKKLSFEINKRVLELLLGYLEFQFQKSFPTRDQYKILVNNESVTFVMDSTEVFTIPTASFAPPPSSLAYKKFKSPLDYSTVLTKYKTYGLFKCKDERLNTFHTASNTDNSHYYLRVLSAPENEKNSNFMFDIMYAHISGSGSKYNHDNFTVTYPAKTIYRNYLMEYFDKIDGKIPFKNGKNGDYFYAINFNTELYPEMIDPGNIQIHLAPITSNPNQLYNTGSNFYPNTSSNIMYSLIDDSNDTTGLRTLENDIKEYYYLVSGSLNDGIYGESSDDAWGIIFPRKGIIILDGVVLDQSCSLNTVTASIAGDNIRKFFMTISGSCNTTDNRSITGSWYARASEEVVTQTYFCRINQNEFNYSNNYTYVSGSNNLLKYPYFMDSPISYITSVGLYNDNYELIAIGKLPKPILKKSNEEHIIQVRLRLN
jgi:hypothetical protein